MSTTPAIIQLVQAAGDLGLPIEQALKEYNPEEHAIFDRSKRKKRKKIVPTGQTKIVGEGPNAREVDVTKTVYEEVNRIAFPMQKLIVRRRAAFMNTGNMKILCKPTDPVQERLLEMVKKCWSDNKMEFKLTEIAERMMSELQVAVLWYSEEVDKGYWGEISPNGKAAMRMKILSPALGDSLLPVFDGGGKLTYFARGYKTKPDLLSKVSFDDSDAALPVDQQEVEHLDIYSKDGMLKFEREKGVWVMKGKVSYSYGKLPISLFLQPGGKPEWHDEQVIIERLETVISNVAEIVDANAFPILFAKGIIKSMPTKGEAGRVLNVVSQLNGKGEEVGQSDLKYITWDSAPEAIKLEIDTLVNFIYTCSQTPDISSKGMADLGVKSGTGFDRVFVDAHLAAMRHTQGNFGETIQRSLNFLISACIAIDTTLKAAANIVISPEFPLFRINDEKETIDMLITATGGEPILSRKTAVGMSGLVQDPEKENKQIEKEQDTLGREIDADPTKKKEKEVEGE